MSRIEGQSSVRYLTTQVKSDLKETMVFVAGPRQVGKTTLALSLLKGGSPEHPAYFNWDFDPDRKKIMQGVLPSGEPLWVFDEIHHYRKWRGLLKGAYDKFHQRVQILVTGSARLDYYNKGGDSLQGRYHLLRLHPLTPRELSRKPGKAEMEQLLQFGGFPQPFAKGDNTFLDRWHHERVRRVLQDDLRDLERVQEVSLIELLVDALPDRVGSPLSVKALSEDLDVAFATTERWLKMLENLFYCYRIPPYGSSRIRAVKKEKKLYLWDYSLIKENVGARFENLVANQLLKYCHWREDTEGRQMDLRFLRDTDKREVDFVILENRKPLFAVECKSGEKILNPHIRYFMERTTIPKFYQVHLGVRDFLDAHSGARVCPFTRFCEEENMP